MVAGNQVDSDLEDEQQDCLGYFCAKLLRRAQDFIAKLIVHGCAEDAVDYHENDDKQLQNAEVRLPEGAAVCIILQQEGFEQKQDAQDGQEHVSGSEIHQVQSQAQRDDEQWRVHQRILVDLADFLVEF